MIIREITFEECLVLWKKLWATRVSAIETTSAMMLSKTDQRIYSANIGTPIFLGAFVDDILVGVNSLHNIDKTTRSRGLYVEPTARGMKIGQLLLEETIARAEFPCWSYPKLEALTTYERAGFKRYSKDLFDDIENKANCYVAV